MRTELVTTLKRQATELLADIGRDKQPILGAETIEWPVFQAVSAMEITSWCLALQQKPASHALG